MALRVDYLVRETGQNLVRNPLTAHRDRHDRRRVPRPCSRSRSCWATGIYNAFQQWNNDVSFIVYVNAEATADQIASLQKDLNESPQVGRRSATSTTRRPTTSSRSCSRTSPTIVSTVKPADLPTSFRVKPKNPDAKVDRAAGREVQVETRRPYKVDFVADAVRAVQRIGGKLQSFAARRVDRARCRRRCC